MRDLLALLRCLLRGHDAILKIEPKEVYLTCQHCGRRSDGWDMRRAV